jgi:tetratricopeptide (TPR) repeat protein
MTAGSQRAALDAIHSARPIVARLSMSRNSEDLAADLIEAWSVTETGLRSLIGGSALTGQTLIRELRQRHFLSLEQANALAEFHAARERATKVEYKPTEGDINASRDAFLKLEAGLMGEGATAPAVGPSSAAARTMAGATAATAAAMHPASNPSSLPQDPNARARFEGTPNAVPAERARPKWLLPVLGLVALLTVGALALYAMQGRGGGASDSLSEGMSAYREGRREAASGAFIKATKEDPENPVPHVYLSRMARETGNLQLAKQEAITAVRLGPKTSVALRELAAVSFAEQNYDAARRFYIRAIEVDNNDKLSQGFLGCSLIRLGRIEEGRNFIQKAGPGAWSSCLPQPGMTPQTGAPMGSPQGAQPSGALPQYQ